MAIRSLLKLPVVGYDSEEEFLKSMHAMLELAKQQPGFISAEIWKSVDAAEHPTYLVESEWGSREAMTAMEHHLEHEEVMSSYPHTPVHLRLVPWVRPS